MNKSTTNERTETAPLTAAPQTKRYGIDIVSISRIQRIIEKIDLKTEKGILNSVFTETEIKNCRSLKNTYKYYAELFAGKEAFLKALGTGLSGDILFSDIEFFCDKDKPPHVNCYGDAKNEIIRMGVTKINVSFSHSRELAVALVTLEN